LHIFLFINYYAYNYTPYATNNNPPLSIPRINIGKYPQDGITDQDIYDERGQGGEIDHKPAQLQVWDDPRERNDQGRRGIVDPTDKRRVDIDHEELQHEPQRQKQFDYPDDETYYGFY